MFKFHHIALSVSQLSRSQDFYQALGFEQVYQYQSEDGSLQIAHLKLGEAILELFCYAQAEDAPLSTKLLVTDLPRLGVKHFGLAVADIHQAKEKLQALGLLQEVEISHGRTGIDYFFVQDPDGIFVEVVQDDRGF
jgi:glyoxylase I family protein